MRCPECGVEMEGDEHIGEAYDETDDYICRNPECRLMFITYSYNDDPEVLAKNKGKMKDAPTKAGIRIKRGAVPSFYSCKACTWLGDQLALGDGGRGVCPNCGSRSLGTHFGEKDIVQKSDRKLGDGGLSKPD